MKNTEWTNCYDKPLRGYIRDESFAHPAKYSLALIERIYDHCLMQGYLQPNDLVGDVFGGIGTGGIAAAYRGLRWLGIELEARFHHMAQANFKMHQHKLEYLGKPQPKIVQGDSRKFHELIAVNGVVSSPPFSGEGMQPPNMRAHAPVRSKFKDEPDRIATKDYGQSEGQIGRLKSGTVEAVISSPPFTQGYAGGGGINKEGYHGKHEFGKNRCGNPDQVGKRTYQGTAGERDEANIETLKVGSVDRVISSPPYAESLQGKENGIDFSKTKDGGKNRTQGRANYGSEYGSDPQQIGRLKGGSVEAVVTSPPFEDKGAFSPSKGIQAEQTANGKWKEGGSEFATGYGETPGQIGQEKGEVETCSVCEARLPSLLCHTVKIAKSKSHEEADGAKSITDSISEGRESQKPRSTKQKSLRDISTSPIRSITENKISDGKAVVQVGVAMLGESSEEKPLVETAINAENADHQSHSSCITSKIKAKPEASGTTALGILKRFAEHVTTGTTQKRWCEHIRSCAKCAESLMCLAPQFRGLALSHVKPLSTLQSIDDGKPEDYWRAMAKVYRSCYQAIKPNGVIILVLKDYIKAGKRVPLCDDTAKLLEHIGFEPLERIHALLVKETRHGDLFTGESVKKTERKSFFRRLAEKKGSPRIDEEQVLIYKRPE